MRTFGLWLCALAAVWLSCFSALPAQSANDAGRIEVQFVYVDPGSIEPTYHTAIWLEDDKGKIARTIFVSTNLSETEYKTGQACPDWVKQSGWETAPRSLINAVTGPTPNVSAGMMPFDLKRLGVVPGKYKFRFEVNITEKCDVLFQGDLVVGDSEQELKIEMAYQPSKPNIATDVVKDVKVHYYPASR